MKQLAVFSDSELLVKQMNGEYRVKNEDLLPLYEEAKRLRRRFESGDASRTSAASRTSGPTSSATRRSTASRGGAASRTPPPTPSLQASGRQTAGAVKPPAARERVGE